jgi:hypothetical protein
MALEGIVEQGDLVISGAMARIGLEPGGEARPVGVVRLLACEPGRRLLVDPVVAHRSSLRAEALFLLLHR